MTDRSHSRLPGQFHSAKDPSSLAARLTRARAQARLFGGQAPAVQVGRFDLIAPLGSGGMGSVFAAHDRDLDREVALKFLHAPEGVGVADLRQRLRREARALAAVSHPNVVAVHTIEEADGRVFIAMERVRGVTLRAWLEGQPGQEAKVALFVTIADALHAAHCQGVAHGDFKPENVMVTDAGEARVLDFGLANTVAQMVALSRPVDDVASGTSSGGTPAYCAPEQLAGAPRDAQSDQFSFCVTMFEALVGHLPRQSLTAADPPSSRPARRIDRVLERGLETDPDARWPSMAALRSRLTRSPRRAPWIVGAGLIGAAAVGALFDVGPKNACDAQARPFEALWTAEHRERIGTAFSATGLPFANEAYARAAEELDAWVAAWSRQHAAVCTARPESPDQADIAMACLSAERRRFSSVVAALEAADSVTVSHVDGALRSLADPVTCGLADAEEAPLSDALVGKLDEAKTRASTGHYIEGLAGLTAASADFDAAGPRARLEYLYRYGELLMHNGAYADAEAALTECYHLASDLGDHSSAGSAAIYLTAVVGERLARADDGMQWSRHAKAAVQRAGSDPDSVAAIHNNVGGIQYRAGEYDAARASFERAVAAWSEAWGPDAPEVASAIDNLGVTLADLAQFEDAHAQLQRSLAIRIRHHGPHHPDVATTLHNKAALFNRAGRYEDARPLAERAIEIRRAGVGRSHPEYAKSLELMGDLQAGLARYDEAETAYAEAAAVAAVALPEDHPGAATPLISLGNMAFYRDDPATARKHYLAALAILQRAYGGGHIRTAKTILNIAATYGVQHELEHSADYYEQGLAITEAELGPEHPQIGSALKGLGTVRRLQGKSVEAVAVLERALTILQRDGVPPRSLADGQATLARALLDEGRDLARARTLADAARATFVELGDAGVSDLAELDEWNDALPPSP